MAKATQGQVTKIYELRTLGFDELSKELKTVNTLFENIKKAKLSAEGKFIAATDIADIKKYAEEVAKLKLKEAELKVESQKLTSEIKAEQLARQQSINQQRQQQQQYNAEIGSIKALRAEIKELNAAIISRTQGGDVSFRGQTLGYDAAIQKLQQLTTAEQNFRRQFAQDRLLVGEYTSGIVQAFKSMGLDDLIGGQITKASQRINSLDSDFEKLKQELSTVGVSGKGSLEKIELQLIENRKEALSLQQQVGQLKTEFRGTGDVGNQVTASLKKGFQDIKGQVGQFVLGYVGFQAILNSVQKTFSETVALDSLSVSLKNVSNNSAELAINQKFLLDLTERLGLVYTDTAVTFKNFYAASTQAGISADDTREIFTAAAAASANLKLSQEDTNGVLLAFSQIASKGKVQAEELRGQIGERVPGAFAIAARAIGVTQKELNKMLETGQVTSNDFLPKFARELQKTFGGDATKNVDGLQASIARLKNQFTQLVQDNQGALTSIFSALIGGAGALIKLIPSLLVLLGLLAGAYLANNAALIAYNAAIVLNNIFILRNYVLLGILSAAQFAYNTVLLLANRSLALATAGLRLFGITATISAGPLGVILAILGLIAGAAVGLSKAMANSSIEIDRNTQKLRAMRDVQQEAVKATAEQRTKAEALTAAIKDLSLNEATRNKLLNDLIAIDPIFQKALVDGKINYENLNQALQEYNKSLLERATIEAASTKSTKEQQDLVNLINIRTVLEERKRGIRDRNLDNLSEEEKAFLGGGISFFGRITDSQFNDAIKNVSNAISKQQQLVEVSQEAFATLLAKKSVVDEKTTSFEVDIVALKATIDRLNKEIDAFQGTQTDLNKKISERNKAQEALDKLLGKGKTDSRGSRLTGEQKDLFKEIDAQRDTSLAKEEARRLKDEISESDYLKNILTINQQAIDAKLAIIKGKNAEELKVRAQLQLERIKQESDTNEKLQAIAEKQFDQILKNLKAERDQKIRDAKVGADGTINDPTATEAQKAQARLDADNLILAAEETFGSQLDLIERQIGLQSIQNVQETATAITKARQDIANDEKDLALSTLDDLKKRLDTDLARFKATISAARLSIINSDRSKATKSNLLSKLDQQETIGALGIEISGLADQLPKYKSLLDQRLITDKEYNDFLAALNKKREDYANAVSKSVEDNLRKVTDLKGALQNVFRDLFKLQLGSETDNLLGQTIASAYNLGQDAMNSYFDQEKERIEQSKRQQLSRLDIEKEQLLAKASSRAEELSIEKQFRAKQDAINRAAFEKNKKQQIAQANINLATQLSNLAVIAFSPNPANIATLGLAGTIMYAIQAALAIAGYGINVGRINRQQYAFGGDVPTKGGEFGGKPHSDGGTPFGFKGEQYEAEVDELAIIRTRNAPRNRIYNFVGTHKQIASALNAAGGGINFAPGATMRKFASGGYLGDSLQAPIFIPSSNNNFINNSGGISEEKFDLMMKKMDTIAEEQSKRIDRLEVVQVTSTVTNAQKKEAKQNSIGVL